MWKLNNLNQTKTLTPILHGPTRIAMQLLWTLWRQPSYELKLPKTDPTKTTIELKKLYVDNHSHILCFPERYFGSLFIWKGWSPLTTTFRFSLPGKRKKKECRTTVYMVSFNMFYVLRWKPSYQNKNVETAVPVLEIYH